MNKTLQQFLEDKNKKLILIFTPTHGNLGDSAIVLAELEFLKDNFKDFSIYEFTKNETLHYGQKIASLLTQNDVILIPGGGYLGSLWKYNNNLFINFLKTFKSQKIVVFPQTIFFKDSENKIKNDFFKVTQSCKDLTIFCRDYNSFKILKDMKVNFKYEYVPDIVLYHQTNFSNTRNNKVLLCFRKDHEKIQKHDDVLQYLKQNKIQFVKTDTVIGRIVSKHKRNSLVEKKLNQFSKYRMVITDRLHGMLFATITNTPCLAFDNISKKVSGVYQWIKDFDYIKVLTSYDDITLTNTIKNLYDYNNKIQYSNKPLLATFEKIKNAIKNKGN